MFGRAKMSKASIESLCGPRTSTSTYPNSLSTENLDSLHKMVPMHNSYFTNCLPMHGSNSSRPIALSRSAHKQFKRTHKFDVIRNSHPKGLIFVWPQKRNFYYEREYTLAIRVLAQILYWLSEIGLFPSGAGLPLKQPPWYIKPPIPKPENRDYIIEPDWNSIYY